MTFIIIIEKVLVIVTIIVIMSTKKGNRWPLEEVKQLSSMREALKEELLSRRQLPDVVGDRRLLRFLRGHNHNVDKAVMMFKKFLNWRDANNVDSIRDDILYGGIKSPFDFPSGQKIVDLVPQIVIAHDVLDNDGNCIGLEQYCFDPTTVLSNITKDEYIKFLIYMLEYKSLVLDQMSDEKEKKTLAKYNGNPPITVNGYGEMLCCTIIRDFNGFGFGHIGYDGRTVISWVLEIAIDNYPELLAKSHLINVPWFFNTFWVFVRLFLDENILRKITMATTNYMEVLEKEMPREAIPDRIGGIYTGYNTDFNFDISKTSFFHYSGAPTTDKVSNDKMASERKSNGKKTVVKVSSKTNLDTKIAILQPDYDMTCTSNGEFLTTPQKSPSKSDISTEGSTESFFNSERKPRRMRTPTPTDAKPNSFACDIGIPIFPFLPTLSSNTENPKQEER